MAIYGCITPKFTIYVGKTVIQWYPTNNTVIFSASAMPGLIFQRMVTKNPSSVANSNSQTLSYIQYIYIHISSAVQSIRITVRKIPRVKIEWHLEASQNASYLPKKPSWDSLCYIPKASKLYILHANMQIDVLSVYLSCHEFFVSKGV